MINYGLEGARAAMPMIPGIRLMVGTETEYCGMTDTLGMLAENRKKIRLCACSSYAYTYEEFRHSGNG